MRMRRTAVFVSLWIAVVVAVGCKPSAECDAHCGPCDGGDPLANDTISPVRYGSGDQGTPVVELLYEAEASCPGESTRYWLSFPKGAPVLGPPGDKLDTSTADLEYLSDLNARAIVWHNADLLLPYDQTLDAFTFSVIEGGKEKGAYRCASANDVLHCKASN